mmetsp:Transcript_68062/g.220404  ORF Transcript_68062/g.220404 Transcript_68062/m.220404 type:complete len:218 (-) Transcript_68062:363-1016(-)
MAQQLASSAIPVQVHEVEAPIRGPELQRSLLAIQDSPHKGRIRRPTQDNLLVGRRVEARRGEPLRGPPLLLGQRRLEADAALLQRQAAREEAAGHREQSERGDEDLPGPHAHSHFSCSRVLLHVLNDGAQPHIQTLGEVVSEGSEARSEHQAVLAFIVHLARHTNLEATVRRQRTFLPQQGQETWHKSLAVVRPIGILENSLAVLVRVSCQVRGHAS